VTVLFYTFTNYCADNRVKTRAISAASEDTNTHDLLQQFYCLIKWLKYFPPPVVNADWHSLALPHG
jgi:hypothetical protein